MIKGFLVTFLLCILTFLGCSNSQNDKKIIKKHWDEALAQVSVRAAEMQFDMRINRDVFCIMGKTSDNSQTKEKNDVISEFSKRVISGFSKRCEFYVAVENETSALFTEIKKTGKLPKTAYFFEALVFKEISQKTGSILSNIYETIEIGIFENIDDCAKFGGIARASGIPTKACQEIDLLLN